MQQKVLWIFLIRKIFRSTLIYSDYPTSYNRFCQFFCDPCFRYRNFCTENEVPAIQHTNIINIVQRMIICHDPEGYPRVTFFMDASLYIGLDWIGFTSHAILAFTFPEEKSKSVTESTI